MSQQLTHEQIQWEEYKHSLILACDDWQDPRNVGMAFRLADAFGVQEIWLGGDSPCPPSKKITKTARSTEKWTPFQSFTNLPIALQQARNQGYTIWGIEITTNSQPLNEMMKKQVPQPLIIVLGAENKGISTEVLACLDACFYIPMRGKNTSLNVATALAIALWEIGKGIKVEKGKN